MAVFDGANDDDDDDDTEADEVVPGREIRKRERVLSRVLWL